MVKKTYHPFKTYCYNSVITALKELLVRSGFYSLCFQWKTNHNDSGLLTDILIVRYGRIFKFIRASRFCKEIRPWLNSQYRLVFEPQHELNSYLEPLVEELSNLWIDIKCIANINKQDVTVTVRAALLCVACDLPAARKVFGFLGHNAALGCSRCLKSFLVQLVL